MLARICASRLSFLFCLFRMLRASQSVQSMRLPGRRRPVEREEMGCSGEADNIGHMKDRANARSTVVRQRLVIAAYVFSPQFRVC